ncbi:hypothetical protein O6P43_013604 [Quillaja saponaria]|uniref:Uncharacterized protein n=1 Tax=Quillaja saponaria TaxID=32244 RepID=A0AAD7LST8_QUISA|nr:hypothetical protein O6P43_013604 [Quillaja saponaria]
MSNEGDTPSALPFDTSDGHPADGTIMPVGEEPKYRPGKGNVLPPSLAYHPSMSSSSENTESGSFKDEDEATALACFSPEQDEDEESDDDIRPSLTMFRHLHQIKNKSGGWIYFSTRLDIYQGHLDNNKEWKPRYFFVQALSPTDMSLTQEQDATEVRASSRQRLEALRKRAGKALTSKGKRLMNEGTTEGVLPVSTIPVDDRERMPPHSKSGRSHKRARVEPTSREQTIPDSFSLAKVPPHIFSRFPQCGLCYSEREYLACGHRSDRRSSARERIYYWAVCWRSGFLVHKAEESPGFKGILVHKAEDAEYSTDKLLGTIQENENLKARLIQVEKAEAEGRAASEQFESLQAEVEWWLNKYLEKNEEADRLREEIEWCREIESEAVRLRDEVARLRAKLEVSKEEARTAVENFKDSDVCRKMIYDHGCRLYANGWVGCRVWLKECIPSLDISGVKWPGEEESEEEERLANMFTKVEADKEEESEDEGAVD